MRFSSSNTSYNALTLIFKVWLVFCVLWSGYIYLFGDIRFIHPFPKEHWLHNISKPFGVIGIRFIGNVLSGLILYGIFIPFILANYFTKKIYNTYSWINFIIYIFLLQSILYTTSILIDYFILFFCDCKSNIIFHKRKDVFNFIKFFMEIDFIYMCVFTLSVFFTMIEVEIKN